jgi:hypothetical protein
VPSRLSRKQPYKIPTNRASRVEAAQLLGGLQSETSQFSTNSQGCNGTASEALDRSEGAHSPKV